jgi:hypothetical protein
MAAREKPGPPMTLGNMRRRPRAYSNVPSLRAQSRRERGRFGSNDLRSGGRPTASAQPMRRETDRYPASVAYEVDEKPRGGGPNAGERRGPNYAKDVLLASH